jgi:Ca2+-binding RTX toxin-like protein
MFSAAVGEENVVTVSIGQDGGLVFRDANNPVAAVAPCVAIDDQAARCPRPGVIPGSIDVSLGDQPDVLLVDLRRNGVTADGGDGADTLVGSDGDDDFRGGSGDDHLEGQGGDDRLAGDGVGGVVSAGDLDGSDLISGGQGLDSADYSSATGPVIIDLLAGGPTQGEAGEGDTLSGIEQIDGSGYDDLLLGSDGPDVIFGGGGADTIDGRGGDDTIYSRRGTVQGGPGDDSISAFDPAPLAVMCGSGRDEVDRSYAKTSIASDCEGLPSFGLRITPAPTVTSAGLRFELFCRKLQAYPERCGVRIRVRATSGKTTSAYRKLGPGRRGSITVPNPGGPVDYVVATVGRRSAATPERWTFPTPPDF